MPFQGFDYSTRLSHNDIAHINSITSNTELTPLKDCTEAMQTGSIGCGGSVVKASSHRWDGHVFKSTSRALNKTIQLSCVLQTQCNVTLRDFTGKCLL